MSRGAIEIPKLRFSEPRWNLPGRKGAATAEDRFTLAFARAYLEQADAIHHGATRSQLALAREIPVNGYGIADLHVVAWEPLPKERFPSVESFVEVARPCTRAFECKLTDWRRAMSQAGRYRFFANQAFVVLPESTCKRALPFIQTFRKIKVGLWSFNPATGRIKVHYTPRSIPARSDRYYLHAVKCVHSAAKPTLPIQ